MCLQKISWINKFYETGPSAVNRDNSTYEMFAPLAINLDFSTTMGRNKEMNKSSIFYSCLQKWWHSPWIFIQSEIVQNMGPARL